MKKIFYIVGLAVFAFLGLPAGQAGWSVYAHGTDTGMSGSMGMMKMMEIMHENMDENQSMGCSGMSDMEMMEEGEEMMEEMMGHEDHERMEAAMNEEDHDSMHMMMGMWSSGCIGEETMGTLAARYGYDGMMGPGMVQNNWGMSWWGMGGLAFVTSLLVWTILILAIVALWKWIKKPSGSDKIVQ